MEQSNGRADGICEKTDPHTDTPNMMHMVAPAISNIEWLPQGRPATGKTGAMAFRFHASPDRPVISAKIPRA